MPTAGQKAANQPSTRGVGSVTTPHRYGRRTRQLAIRTPNPKRKGRFRIATRTQLDLILLDVMMPGLDGFEICRRLKENSATSEIPVILITAHNETKKMVEGFQAGSVDYITKAFQHKEVRVRVRNHLTIKSLLCGKSLSFTYT